VSEVLRCDEDVILRISLITFLFMHRIIVRMWKLQVIRIYFKPDFLQQGKHAGVHLQDSLYSGIGPEQLAVYAIQRV
jgi:hypothetical protein